MKPRCALLFVIALSGCSTKAATSPADGAPSSVVSAAPTVVASATQAPSAEPTASASAVASASASASASAAADSGPVPSVGVSNIGMHIGGGPNDDITKDPIRRSVSPHFDEFRRCFPRVEESKQGDFGVDLRIDRAGGKAKVSHPRTALKGKEFKECVVQVFEGIDFLKPRGGTTTVSYSLRFTPH